MHLRCLHSCMVCIVLAMLIIYSTYLSQSSINESSSSNGANAANSNNSSSSSYRFHSSGLLLLRREEEEQSNNDNINLRKNSIIYTVKAEVVAQQQQSETEDKANTSNNNAAAGVGAGGQEPPPLNQQQGNMEEGAGGNPKSDTGASGDKNAQESQKMETSASASNAAKATLTKDIYEFGFSAPNVEICKSDSLKLFIMIMSAPSHSSARNAIRLTWGHYTHRSDLSIGFLIGRTDNTTLLDSIETEQLLYNDLIVANFIDSYDNLTLKTMSTLEWMQAYCNNTEYLLKTDDDMFINVPNLLNFIDRIQEDDKKLPKIYGRLAKKWKPVRNKKSKYYISFAQYRKSVYPDFTTGPAYLLSTSLTKDLFERGLSSTYLKLEDVYTTGIIAQELGIKRMNIVDFANKKVNFHKTGYCALTKLISMHMVAYHEQFELWKKILDGRTKCKIIYKNAPKKS